MTDKYIAYLTSLHGWCPAEKMRKLYELITSCPSEIEPMAIDMGVWAGRSLFPMALAMRDMKRGMAYGYDAWSNVVATEGTNNPEDDAWWGKVDMNMILTCFKKSIEFLSLNDWIAWDKIKTQEAARRFEDNSVWLIHQDSAHNVETIIAELELWIPKLVVGGYWVTDDNDWDKAKEGYAKLPEYGLELVEDFVKWQVWKKVK